jgi:valyl-tRNA synthetase
VLAETGERMSRSKGIGVDPVVLIDKYGACALRFTMAYLEAGSQTYRFWEQKVEIGRNFANKIWNAARLIKQLQNLPRNHEITENTKENSEFFFVPSSPSYLRGNLLEFSNPIDNWILSKFNQTIETVTKALDKFAFSAAAQSLYSFFWHDFCDWYLEMCKIRKNNNDLTFFDTLNQVFNGSIILLHPFMPFLTEEIWNKFNYKEISHRVTEVTEKETSERKSSVVSVSPWQELPQSIMQANWPRTVSSSLLTPHSSLLTEAMRELIVGIRNIRAEMRIDIKKPVSCFINTTDTELSSFLLSQENQNLIFNLAKVSELKVTGTRPAQSSIIVIKGLEAYVPLAGLIDFDKERARIQTEIESLGQELDKTIRLLADDNFINKAKPAIIEREKERKEKYQDKITRLKSALEALK